MTGFSRPRSRNRDVQDYVVRGVWGGLEYVPNAGASMSVRGTGTLDEEVPLLNLGYSFNLPVDSDAEMVMLALGSDVNDKVVLATIPRSAQHPWGEGEGGIQHPTDPSRRIEFNANETYLSDGSYVLGANREVSISVSAGVVNITVAGNTTVVSTGQLTLQAPSVEITSATLTHNGTNIGDTHTHNIAGGLAPSVSGGPQ